MCKGYALRKVEANTPLLSMGYLEETGSTTRTVRFNSAYDGAFRWRPDLTTHSEYVQLEEVSADAGTAIAVRLDNPRTTGVYKEKLDFRFETESSPASWRYYAIPAAGGYTPNCSRWCSKWK